MNLGILFLARASSDLLNGNPLVNNIPVLWLNRIGMEIQYKPVDQRLLKALNPFVTLRKLFARYIQR